MLNQLRDLFARPVEDDETAGERLRLATCVLLMEAAAADDEFTQTEQSHVVSTLRTRFALSSVEADELMQAASEKRAESYDLWQFTHQVNEASSLAEKIGIIEEVWRVVYADGTLDGHEDYLVHKLARLLNLTHRQLIDAKMKVLKETRG